jgi:hypothetical protein
MRLTKQELRLLLRAMHYAVGTNTSLAPGSLMPMTEEVERLIAAMELFFGNENSGRPARAQATDRNEEVGR